MKYLIALYTKPNHTGLIIKSYLQIFSGCFVLALGYVLFIVPHHIVPGGIFGLSIVLNHIGGPPVGLMALFINIPLLLWGTKVLGKTTGLKTAFAMIMVSLLVDGLTIITHSTAYVNDILVSSVFGGILVGLAVFIVMRAGATTGGNDILVRILSKYIKLPYSQLILLVDGIIVFLGVLVFGDFTMAAYCVIAIISISKTIEHLLKKSNQNHTVLIFSKHNNEIKNRLECNIKLQENIIRLIYHEERSKMILITKTNKQTDRIERLVSEIDEDAYISVLDSNYRV